MVQLDWSLIFDRVYPNSGASELEIVDLQASALRPLNTDELTQIRARQRNPFPKRDPFHSIWRPFDPAQWLIPTAPFPDNYLNCLRWSNGGECWTGERCFQFFSTDELRDTMLAYNVPEYMPGAIPFAFNGGGTFYMFDVRKPSVRGEYPIICSRAGSMGFSDDSFLQIAESFCDACRGDQDVDELLFKHISNK